MLASFILFSQSKIKFGSITEAEITSKSNKNYPDAHAEILYESMDSWFELHSNDFQIKSEYIVRIKIYDSEGLSYANAAIDFNLDKRVEYTEKVNAVAGFTYNYENGKIVKTKLEKENIFTEKVSDYTGRVKIAFPSVKPGSVVEYRYQLISPGYSMLRDIVFQRDIPVRYSRREVRIPDFFMFNIETKGYETINYKRSTANESFIISGAEPLNCVSETYLYEVNNLPPIKGDKYVWCASDFMSGVTFEIRSLHFPGQMVKNFSSNWESVDDYLFDYPKFGQQLRSRFFRDELNAVIKPDMNGTDKLTAILDYIKSRVRWNRTKTILIENPREALRSGTGTSGEINALLISALREAGFDAYPVLMSTKPRGRVPLSHPTLSYFNQFVTGVDYEGLAYYMDPSDQFSGINNISPELMTDMARSIRTDKRSEWVDLSTIGKNSLNVTIIASLDKSGVLNGNITNTYRGSQKYEFLRDYNNRSVGDEFTKELESDLKSEISDLSVSGLKGSDPAVTLKFGFRSTESPDGAEIIYINPLITPIYSENPFKAEERRLPVEFAYPIEQQIVSTIILDENYIIEDLPKPIRISLNNSDISFTYMIAKNDAANSVSVKLIYKVSRIIYDSSSYAELRNFFTHIVSANNAQIVLKKRAK